MRLGASASVVLAILVATAPLRAAPTIDIRAQTQVLLERVQVKDAGTVEVFGQLVDRLTGDGLGGQTVTIRIAGTAVTARTEPDGRFRKVVPGPVGPTTVELFYRGNALMEPAEQSTLADPSREVVTLAIVVSPIAPGTDPRIVVTARTADRAVELPVDLSVGSPSETTLTKWKTVTTGDTPHPLPRAQAGGVGARRVRAAFAGSDTLQPASAETTLELFGDTTTEMTLSADQLAFEDALAVRGRVLDSDAKPVARAAVTLLAGDRRLAHGATDAAGRYAFEVEAEVIGQGQFAIQVDADPGISFVRASRSAPKILRVAAPQPVPVSYTVAAFIATLAAAGGFFLARTRPWLRLRRPPPPAETAATPHEQEPTAGGLVTNKPGMMSTLRRPHDEGFTGVVRDTVRGRPVAGARVCIVVGKTEQAVLTGDDGSFAFERLPAGEHTAAVSADGHVTEQFGVSIPHRGELRGARIDLVPVRERVFQLYRQAAEPSLPEPRLWGVWSPRQIVDHVRSRRPSPALAELTDFVEEVYFSGRLAMEGVLPVATDRVERAVREQTART